MTSPLILLAEKVEGLEGPDRGVDCLTYATVHIPADRAGKIDISAPYVGWHPVDGPYVSAIEAPRYTASVDSAMSLVPEGFMWRLQSWPDGVNSALLEKDAGDFGAIDARHTESFATTPALALVAAALRARAAMEAGE